VERDGAASTTVVTGSERAPKTDPRDPREDEHAQDAEAARNHAGEEIRAASGHARPEREPEGEHYAQRRCVGRPNGGRTMTLARTRRSWRRWTSRSARAARVAELRSACMSQERDRAVHGVPSRRTGYRVSMSASPDPRARSILVEELADWRGQDVVDERGDKLGKLDDVLYDGESDHPAFAAVRSGTLSKHLTYVPLVGATVGREYVRLRLTKAALKKAPTFDPDMQLTAEDEAGIYGFYGMDYAPTAEGGRRLARR
jgi:hypothetical protein